MLLLFATDACSCCCREILVKQRTIYATHNFCLAFFPFSRLCVAQSNYKYKININHQMLLHGMHGASNRCKRSNEPFFTRFRIFHLSRLVISPFRGCVCVNFMPLLRPLSTPLLRPFFIISLSRTWNGHDVIPKGKRNRQTRKRHTPEIIVDLVE